MEEFFYAALYLLAIVKFSSALDTLPANQALADGEVLNSPSQMFELGFFNPGSSKSRFLGIWYKATPDVVVWVANRDNPITGLGGILNLSKNGNLFLTSTQGQIIWYSNSSTAASSPQLQLLDTGNLIVIENSTYLWQSFDHPGNTRLPGMKLVNDPTSGLDRHLTSWKSPDDPSEGDYTYMIENRGLSQMSVFMRGKKQYRSPPWDGIHFTGVPLSFHPYIASVGDLSSDGKLISMVEEYNISSMMRLTLSSSGLLDRYVMNEERDGWILAFSLNNDICNRYGWCGPNGICRAYKQPVCGCLSGFAPKSQKEWDVFSWTRGCGRAPPLDCVKEDGFLKVDQLKFPDTVDFVMNGNTSFDECRDECLMNCSCTAYASPYLSNKSNGCLMWIGDLIDVQEFGGDARAGPSIYIRVPISELEHIADRNKRKQPAKIMVAAVGASFGVFVLGLSFGVLFYRMRKKRQAYKKRREEFELPFFSLSTIATATGNFSDDNVLGEGGFGPVYKGILSDEQVIAVKRMSRGSGQGPQEFKNEVILIAKLQHRNLVRILGCCIEGEEKMLIYEYMHNKSLDYFIFDNNRSALLNWPTRFDIIMGIARGLLYLHHDSRLKIIHRDLKAGNILLDEDLKAKIADFGLARMLESDQTMASTKRVVGTYGYMAPEYVFDGKFSVKSDVFSMGVVILEIVSGKKNRGFKHPSYQNLLEQAWMLWKEGKELEMLDPCYVGSCVDSQVKRCIQVGLLCVQNAAGKRPVMPSVVVMLSSQDTVLAEPEMPGFCLHSSSSRPSQMYDASKNSVSISEVQGR